MVKFEANECLVEQEYIWWWSGLFSFIKIFIIHTFEASILTTFDSDNSIGFIKAASASLEKIFFITK